MAPAWRKSCVAAAFTLLGGCAAVGDGMVSLPAVSVTASGETTPVGTVNADAADDPAIWRNPANPANSLIVGTDKKAGLYVYGLDGAVRDFVAAGELNNVDLAGNADGALVVASDRTDPANSHVAMFQLSAEGTLTPQGRIASGPGEAYGLCLQRHRSQDGAGGSQVIYAAIKDGTVRELRIDRQAGGTWQGTPLRSWKIATQIEGCVTNPRNGDLFIGEENVGIWRIQTSLANAEPELFASVGEQDGLVADVEGLAFAAQENGPDYLIASSQGDNAYAVFHINDGALVGRFRIADGIVDGTSETDGIEVSIGDLPGFPGGLFVAQDGDNSPSGQNFKLVSWDAIVSGMGLR
ncbi:hypothetical protein GCM10009127_27170 [Alteraurantiacibacter aestuarii]|uniref:Phytase n=1 Tax=Alteraurantiacibacter aestuarii TaxID=650004 RepID=A0A844ZM42_9SPHN|nr:phytase [Alteraurantiacibacter aestuarii]MXO88828.1 phytase [Alteraurantiacibacter aestuarii]